MLDKKQIYIVFLLFFCFVIVAKEGKQEEAKRELTSDMVVPLLRNDDFFKEFIALYESSGINRKSYKDSTLKHFEDYKRKWPSSSREMIPRKVRLKEVLPKKTYGKQSSFGYEYHLPWKLNKKEVSKSSVRYSSDNRNLVVCFDPGNNHVINSLLQNGVYKTFIDRFVAKEKKATKYDLWVSALNTTSKSFKFDGKEKIEEMTESMVLFILKKIFAMESSVVYQFDLGDIKGFQFGQPGKDKWIYFHLFDKQDRFIEIFVANKGNRKTIPQQKLNELIMSLKIKPAKNSKPAKE